MSEQRPEGAGGAPRREAEQGAGRPEREPTYEGYFGSEEEEGAVRLQDDAERQGDAERRPPDEPAPSPREAGAGELPAGESVIDPARRNPEAPGNIHDRTPSGEGL